MKELILVEYSATQKAFHKQPLTQAIERNLENLLLGKNIDYIPIGLFESDDSADEFIRKVYEIIKKTTI